MNSVVVYICFFIFTLVVLLFLYMSTIPLNLAELMTFVNVTVDDKPETYVFENRYLLTNKEDMSLTSGKLVFNNDSIVLNYDGKLKILNERNLSQMMLLLKEKKSSTPE